MLDVAFRSAKQLAASIRRKKLGCLELLELYLGRVEKYNPVLNAIVVRDLDRARGRARAADRALARGEVWGPLHGVPMTIKESYDVAGLSTTWGLPALKDNVPAKNAVCVDRLLGRLGSRDSRPAATSALPSATRRTSAACSDTSRPGGSYRAGQALPGQIAPVDIDVVGPLARSSDDLTLALSIMAGPEAIEAAGWKLRLRPPRQKRLRDYKVALMLESPESEVDDHVKERLLALGEFLRRQKVKVDERARPAIDTGEAFSVYARLLRAATSGRQNDAEFAANLDLARGLAPDDETYYARALRANVLYHRDWLAANEARHRMRLAWAEFFTTYDLLLCPVAGVAAFPHDQEGERHQRTLAINGRPRPVTDHLFWAGYSGASYLPSTAAPCGFTAAGLPVGVQIVGPQFGDLTCLAFAGLLEREFQAFVPPPGYV